MVGRRLCQANVKFLSLPVLANRSTGTRAGPGEWPVTVTNRPCPIGPPLDNAPLHSYN